MKEAPEKIYLPTFPGPDFTELCLDDIEGSISTKIEGRVVEYIREDVVGKMMRYDNVIKQMELDVIKCLSELENGYGMRKWSISEQTGIPENILTVVLKRLRQSNKAQLIPLFDEGTGMPNGSGYCVDEKGYKY